MCLMVVPMRFAITSLLEVIIDRFADHNHHHMIDAHDNISRFGEELDSVRE